MTMEFDHYLSFRRTSPRPLKPRGSKESMYLEVSRRPGKIDPKAKEGNPFVTRKHDRKGPIKDSKAAAKRFFDLFPERKKADA